MKTLILLSAIALTVVSVQGQSREGQGNKKNNDNKQSSISLSRPRQTTSNNRHSSTGGNTNRTSPVSSNKRSSNYTNPGSSVRRSSTVTTNQGGSAKNNSFEANDSRQNSYTGSSARRGGNNSGKNEGMPYNQPNFNSRRENSDRVSIVNRSYNPAESKGYNQTIHYYNNNYVSHHARVEHWNYRGYEYSRHYLPLSERRIRYPFIVPRIAGLIWSLELRNEYLQIYPEFRLREYSYGYRIPSISAYDAEEYIGEIASVYGDVIETEYSPENDEYYLYIGQYYPNQDFSIVVPGNIARSYSVQPDLYFQGSHILVNGLITAYNNKPEIYVRRPIQLTRYNR